MNIQANAFVQLSTVTLNDKATQTAVQHGTQTAVFRRQQAMAETSAAHGQAMRQQAAQAKRFALANLPDLLVQAEANLQANGVTVLWAVDAAEAGAHVLEIARRHHVRKVAKSKSMVTEEIGLNEVLETADIETVETDLGEYILQLNQEAPSHIVAPVIHKSKESIRHIFEREIQMPPTDSAADMAHFARQQLRQAFLSADMGVSGGNFIIAETGSICLVTNEGNARMVTSLPRVHVAVVGIEKIAATLDDYVTLTQVLSRSATGQKLTVYTHLVNGPRRPEDVDGPEHVYVVLVDNGRSRIYANPDYVEALACIRCGACLNTCPVYQSVGGHAYGWVYPGPIGSIITPLLNGIDQATPLPFASTLCGSCKEACPVDIDLPRMLLTLRRDLVAAGQTERSFAAGIKLWAESMARPGVYRFGSRVAKLSNRANLKKLPGVLGGWTDHRTPPQFASLSFREAWAAKYGRSSAPAAGDDTDE